MGFFSQAFLVFLMKESEKRRQKQPGKLMVKSRSQPVNLPGAWPLMNPRIHIIESHESFDFRVQMLASLPRTYSLRHRKCGARGFIHELFVSKTRTSEVQTTSE